MTQDVKKVLQRHYTKLVDDDRHGWCGCTGNTYVCACRERHTARINMLHALAEDFGFRLTKHVVFDSED